MKAAGNTVISIVGARSKEYVILEQEVRAVSDETFITTDDGSYYDKGYVTTRLTALLEAGRRVDLVLAIGPVAVLVDLAISALELFVAVLQAYIFSFLSALFIGLAVRKH
jgi:ferredoxin--NADP+ reductase